MICVVAQFYQDLLNYLQRTGADGRRFHFVINQRQFEDYMNVQGQSPSPDNTLVLTRPMDSEFDKYLRDRGL